MPLIRLLELPELSRRPRKGAFVAEQLALRSPSGMQAQLTATKGLFALGPAVYEAREHLFAVPLSPDMSTVASLDAATMPVKVPLPWPNHSIPSPFRSPLEKVMASAS